MKPNMGGLDRLLRLLAAIIIGVLYFANVITGTTAIVLLGIALVMLFTSMISFCPLYYPFGIDTRTKSK